MRVGTIMGIVAVATTLFSGCGHDESVTASPALQTATGAGPVAVATDALVTGDCLRGVVIGARERRELRSVEAVSCSTTHELEVIATFMLQVSDFDTTPAGDYPGEQRIVDAADDGCLERLGELGVDRATVGVIAVWPTAQSWAEADRTVACAAFSADGTPFEHPSLLASEA